MLKNKYGANVFLNGKYLQIYKGRDYKGIGFTGINGDAIESYFMHKNVDLVLQVGSFVQAVHIALGFTDNSTYLISTGNTKSNDEFFRISNIPKEELNNISSINAKIVISNRK